MNEYYCTSSQVVVKEVNTQVTNELMLYVRGEQKPARADRAVVKQAKTIYDNAAIDAFRARGHMAVAGEMLNGLSELHAHAKKLSEDDPAMMMICGEIVGQTVNNCKQILKNRVGDWTY